MTRGCLVSNAVSSSRARLITTVFTAAPSQTCTRHPLHVKCRDRISSWYTG
jgi:hypothetical protein